MKRAQSLQLPLELTITTQILSTLTTTLHLEVIWHQARSTLTLSALHKAAKKFSSTPRPTFLRTTGCTMHQFHSHYRLEFLDMALTHLCGISTSILLLVLRRTVLRSMVLKLLLAASLSVAHLLTQMLLSAWSRTRTPYTTALHSDLVLFTRLMASTQAATSPTWQQHQCNSARTIKVWVCQHRFMQSGRNWWITWLLTGTVSVKPTLVVFAFCLTLVVLTIS